MSIYAYIYQYPENDVAYVIAWKSKLTGADGGGTATFPKDRAEAIAKQLDRDWPELEHWAKPADKSSSDI
jgi:hypothetical protein